MQRDIEVLLNTRRHPKRPPPAAEVDVDEDEAVDGDVFDIQAEECRAEYKEAFRFFQVITENRKGRSSFNLAATSSALNISFR